MLSSLNQYISSKLWLNVLTWLSPIIVLAQPIEAEKSGDVSGKLLQEFIESPIIFKQQHLAKYVYQLKNYQIEALIPKLYQGLSGIQDASLADQGFMGALNLRSQNFNNRIFLKRIKKRGRKNKKVVLIEGDSWFNFPLWGKSDLTKMLRKKNKKKFLVYTSAFGGDWISRMIKDQSYYQEMIRLRPDAFILSGGGNDLVGTRLSSFIDLPNNNSLVVKEVDNLIKGCKADSNQYFQYTGPANFLNGFNCGDTIDKEVLAGTRYLNPRFFKMMVELELQYRLIIQQINNENESSGNTNNHFKIILQGYDYPIPRNNKTKPWCNFFRSTANYVLNTGQWISTPMKVKGVDDLDTQRIIMKAMIYYFNEMLYYIAIDKRSQHVYYIDNRGLLSYLGGIEPARYWYDELHPKRKPYQIIQKAISTVIENKSSPKVFGVLDDFKQHDPHPQKTQRIRKRKNHCGCYKVTH
jgi:hypothetical protein